MLEIDTKKKKFTDREMTKKHEINRWTFSMEGAVNLEPRADNIRVRVQRIYYMHIL